jgi:hypothetical protein
MLIQTRPGRSGDVAGQMRLIQGVSVAVPVTGPYDIIGMAEAVDLDSLKQEVLAKIQELEGVTRTVTCPVLHLE